MTQQLLLPGISHSAVTRREMEDGIVYAAEACESARYTAWLKRHDDGLARRSLRWRRLRSLEGARYWSSRAFALSEAFYGVGR